MRNKTWKNNDENFVLDGAWEMFKNMNMEKIEGWTACIFLKVQWEIYDFFLKKLLMFTKYIFILNFYRVLNKVALN